MCQGLKEKVAELRLMVHAMDIPHPTCPEYVEHHECMQKLLKFIDEELLVELKTYPEWRKTFEIEYNCKVHDDDGYRALISDDRQEDLLTRSEALAYFNRCTILRKGGIK